MRWAASCWDRLDGARSRPFELGPARALVVTGPGDRAFCAGADIAELISRPISRKAESEARAGRGFQKVEDLPIPPSIALVHGYALRAILNLPWHAPFTGRAEREDGPPRSGLG